MTMFLSTFYLSGQKPERKVKDKDLVVLYAEIHKEFIAIAKVEAQQVRARAWREMLVSWLSDIQNSGARDYILISTIMNIINN